MSSPTCSRPSGYLADPALLDRLVKEKLEREAEAVRAEGWQWVEIMPDIDWNTLRGFEELRGKRQPLPPKDAKKLAKLQREREAFSEDGEYTDDELDRCERLDAEIKALEESALVFSDRQKARAGAFVSIGRDGSLEIVRGLVRPDDSKAKKPEDDEEAATGDDTTAAVPGLSRPLTDDLTAHRTAALRARLAQEPQVALAAIVQALAQRVFYDPREESGLAMNVSMPSFRAEGIDDSAAMKRLLQLAASGRRIFPNSRKNCGVGCSRATPTCCSRCSPIASRGR